MDDTTDRPRTPWTLNVRNALILAVIFAAAVFAWRGPRFAWQYSDDFILVYGPARALLVGANPYNAADIDRVWLEAGGPIDRTPSTREDGALIYPLTTLALFAPFATLPWSLALPTWVIANLLFLGVIVWTISRIAGFQIKQRRTWVFIIAALLFMPVHTVFRVGQTPLMVLALIGIGFLISGKFTKPRSALSGVFLSLAALIKPQIGLPFVALELLHRRWLALIAAIVIAAAVIAVAIVPITARGVPWWSNWQTNLSNFTHNSVGDPTAANPVRHQLLNLHYPLHGFIQDRQLVKALTLTICALLAAAYFWSWMTGFAQWALRHRKDDVESGRQVALARLGVNDSGQTFRQRFENQELLQSLSMIAVLSLMVVYHRYYDAVLLLLPLAWSIGAVSQDRRNGWAWCILALTVPFFLNAATLLHTLEQHAALPAWIIDQWWWTNLLMPVQAWALLLMAMCLIFARPPRGSVIHEFAD